MKAKNTDIWYVVLAKKFSCVSIVTYSKLLLWYCRSLGLLLNTRFEQNLQYIPIHAMVHTVDLHLWYHND